ncbi:MAG TPA: VOC family protein [Verrucomicrobiae bacterium]|jgi:catechol 2,3-dioxygenase-like lactoylglutathione lyase family enzyme|nr:VOC family protein [Verrucomicrobiae bacterium]
MTTAPAAAPPIVHALDHVVVAVRDLDAAVAAYRVLLGRAPAWRAEAHGGGAAVVTFALGNVAVELMAPSGTGATAERLTAVLAAQGEGLVSLAFATADIERAHRRLARLGLEPEPITDGASTDTDTGARRPWRRTRAATGATHGVRLFFLQQAPLAPSRPLVPEPAAVSGLDHVVIRTPDPERATALYGARLALDMRLDRSNPAWGARLLFFRCGDLIVEVAHDLSAGVGDGPDRLWGLSWRVPDAEAARARLRAAGLDASEVRAGRKPGTRVLTLRDGTCGVPTLLLERGAARDEG